MNRQTDRQHKLAFTLSEVLITLGIIGVVAALTIPVLVNSYQKQEYVTGLKKSYTQANQALIQMAADNNCVGDLACTGFFASDKNTQSLGTEIVKYFKVIKNCETTTAGCMPDSFEDTSLYRFISADGTSFQIASFDLSGLQPDCGDTNWSRSGVGSLSKVCGYLTMDVNGLKKPNTIGRDIFFFYITNGNGPLLVGHGAEDDSGNDHWSDGSCYISNTYGYGCAGRIIEEGWKMNY